MALGNHGVHVLPGSPEVMRIFLTDGAEERTRTSTPCRALHPECSASANSATSASSGNSPATHGNKLNPVAIFHLAIHQNACQGTGGYGGYGGQGGLGREGGVWEGPCARSTAPTRGAPTITSPARRGAAKLIEARKNPQGRSGPVGSVGPACFRLRDEHKLMISVNSGWITLPIRDCRLTRGNVLQPTIGN